MKKLLYPLAFALATFLILYSCSAEEEDTTPPPQVQQPATETEPEVSQYTLTVTAGEGGTVSTEGGTYDEGTEITITATPAEGYEFIGWEGSDSTEASLIVTLEANTTLNALFTVIINSYTLTVTAGEGGTVSTEGGAYDEGTEVTITATPDEGYVFIGWYGIDSSDAILLINVESNQSIQAIFQEIQALDNLIDNLNFENLNSIINNDCSSVFGHNGYRFYTNISQPFLQTKKIVFNLNSADLSPYTEGNNYLIFWFNNSNIVDLIQVYKNQILVESFNIENNLNGQLNSLTSYFDNDNFYSQTKFDFEENHIIEDGIYIFSGYEKRIENTQSEDRFKCTVYGISSSLNHLNEEGREYFKIIDGNIVGRTLIFDSDLSSSYKVWQLNDHYYTDTYTNKSRLIDKLEKIEIDNYSLNNLNLSNTLKLVVNDQINGYKTSKILSKVSTQDIGITMIDSFEGIGFYADEIYSQIDFNDPSTYLEAFIKDAQRHGVDLSYVNKNNFQFTIIPDNLWTLESSAYASRICDDNQIDVTFKESVWLQGKIPYKTSVPSALKTMWHEFGHDILNLDHVCLGDHIMSGRHQEPKIVYSSSDCDEEYITVYGMDWDNLDPRKNFQRAVNDMFSGFEQINFNCTTGKRVIIF